MSLSKKNYLYTGVVGHRRFTPFNHFFKYPLFMAYIDLNTVNSFLKKSWFWNVNKKALVSFHREDYHGDPKKDLSESVRDTVFKTIGLEVKGPIRLLTHLRYFGYCFNPVSFYYCFDKNDQEVEMIMAEVTNTPWNERHCYFIKDKKHKNFTQSLKKEFHVSPFWDMKHDYEWYFSVPNDSINVNMINYKDQKKVFDATLTLKEKTSLTFKNLLVHAFKFPFITLMVFFRIHFQAFKLWIKGATFYDHPKYEENN